MSVEAMALVLNHSHASGTTKLVLLGIANHAGDGGAWPTVATLARYANATERTVQRAIGQLIKAGELRVHRQGGGLAHMRDFERPNRYDVLLVCPATCDRTMNHRIRGYPQPELPLSESTPSDPVTPTSPGDTDVTPPGDTDVTHNHPTNPPVLTSVRSDSRPRAREAQREFIAAAARSAREALQAQKTAGQP